MLALAKGGEAEGLWVRADRQTRGRGRMGRDWASPLGNLYTSTLVRLRADDPPAATLGFVAAVSLRQTLAHFAPYAAFQIKWPNDVMANGAKLSGILLERAGDAVVVGIGVNLASHPDFADRQTISLAALMDVAPSAADFLDVLAEQFAKMVAAWRTQGLAQILALWQAAAHPVGTALNVSLPDGTALSGAFGGLGADGALNLCLADGTVRVIHAGDVFTV